MKPVICSRCECELDDKDLHFTRTLASHFPYCRSCLDKMVERQQKRALAKEQDSGD